MRWLAALLCALVATSPSAKLLEPGAKLRVGGFWAQVDSSFATRLLGGDLGGRIDFESDLGLEDERFSPFLELAYRFNSRHKLAFNYIELHRSSSSFEVDETFEFTWDDTTYRVNAGARVDSELDVDIYQIYYAYTLWQRPELVLIGTLGVHVMDLDARLFGEIRADIQDQPLGVRASEAAGDLTAPLPDVGLLAKWHAAEPLTLTLAAQYLEAEIGDYSGRLLDMRFEATYDVTPRWAIGAGWQEYDLDVTRDKSRLRNDDYRFRYQGPSLVVYFEF